MIRLSVSQYFREKDNLAPVRWSKKREQMDNLWAMGAFSNATMPPLAIVKHLTDGKAICIAALKKNHRHADNFTSAQLMGIDIDVSPGIDALLEDRFVRDHAFLLYPTPSHTDAAPRSRILFSLDTPITDIPCYVRLIKRLMHRFAVPVDDKCKDVVRIFYGSLKSGHRTNLAAVLPLAVLEALEPHPDELKPEREPLTETVIRDYSERKRAEKLALGLKQTIIDKALAVPSGHGERHGAFNDAVMKLISKRHWAGLENVEADLRWLGQQMGRDDDEIRRSIEGAIAKNEHDPFVMPGAPAVTANGNGNGNGKHHEPVPPEPPPLPDTIEPPPEEVGATLVAPPAPSNDVVWRTSDEAMQRYRERLTTARVDAVAPLVMPFKCLWRFSGAARILDAGLLVGVIGMSGGMKTSFCECLTEPWRQRGAHDVLWWGTEWTWEKMADRAVQRHGGVSKTELELHHLWLLEEARNEKNERFGVRLPDHMVERSAHVSRIIESWAGKTHQLEQPISDVERLLDVSSQRIDELHRQGRNVRVCVWDYAQLLDLWGVKNEAERISTVLGKLKLFCTEHRVNGIVASQVTKSSSHAAKTEGDVLEAESGQFFRSDKFNLVLTLKPTYEGRAIKDRGVINVAKNSDGMTGVETVFINPSRFQWLDKVVPESQRGGMNLNADDDLDFYSR